MNELNLTLSIALDHALDSDGVAELLEQLKDHLHQLYDESGPQQAYFDDIKLFVNQMEVY